MDNIGTIITAVAGLITASLGSFALVVRARGAAARPVQVLQRLWDWVQTAGHDDEVPENLRRDVEAVVSDGHEEKP